MGTGRTMEFDGFIAWGKPEGTGVCLTRPFDGQPASVGNGVMVALAATDQAQVQRLHGIALANGGSDEGAPGVRGGGVYAACFRDPDGSRPHGFVIGKGLERRIGGEN